MSARRSTASTTRGVLTLRLDRPDKRNAIDDEMMLGARSRALEAAAHRRRRARHLLEGAGDHFCGGADIVARNAGRRSQAARRQHPAPAARRRPTG